MMINNENINPNVWPGNVMIGGPVKINDNAKTVRVVRVAEQIVSKKRPCDSDQNPSEPLTEKKVVIIHPSQGEAAVEAPVHTNPVPTNPDIEMIEKALGGTELSHVERFEKEHGHTMQAIIQAALQELAVMRQRTLPSAGCGGFKIAGRKKWKLLAQINAKGELTDLAIGKFKIAGGYTKVYLTLDMRAILVPQKARSSSGEQLINAHKMISHLYNQCLKKDRESLKMVLNILPPLPKKIMIGERPILVTPQAIGDARGLFKTPATLSNVVQRLELLRDIAKCLALCHAQGIVHGDIKPPNILISEKHKGILHDFGGGCIFYGADSPQEAADKSKKITMTHAYTHYRDCLEKSRLIGKDADVSRLNALGQASDVFSLGVSTVEALIGWYDANGVEQHPFQIKAYHFCETMNAWFPYGHADSRKDVTVFRGIYPVIDGTMQALLDAALNPRYEDRISAEKFHYNLEFIIDKLKADGVGL